MSRRRHKNGDSKLYYDWLDKAEDDMNAAQLLITSDNCYNACAFHCHQAIEKSLKAYLLLFSARSLDGHNLTWLCKQAVREDHRFSRWLAGSALLNGYYIETRYPTDTADDVEYAEAKESFETAMEMYLFICEQIDDILERRTPQRKKERRPLSF